LRIYPGSDGRFALYEDDGVSMDHTRGISSTIDIRWNDRLKRLSLAFAPGSVMRNFTSRTFRVRLAGSSELKTLDFRDSLVTVDL
jgi:alpha-D-xyloside xylohydrolase